MAQSYAADKLEDDSADTTCAVANAEDPSFIPCFVDAKEAEVQDFLSAVVTYATNLSKSDAIEPAANC